jgi:hypothetical protein
VVEIDDVARSSTYDNGDRDAIVSVGSATCMSARTQRWPMSLQRPVMNVLANWIVPSVPSDARNLKSARQRRSASALTARHD